MFDTAELCRDIPLGDGVAWAAAAWAAGWTIPAKLTVSAWADEHRIIAGGAGAEPGPWRTARNPILREIMDGLSEHSPVQLIDFKKSAQIGATEIGINWAGYVVHRGLDSMIVAQPTKELARAWATTKYDPAVDLMPHLQACINNNNTLEKRYAGGTLWVIWTNSSNQLRQRTARYIFADEVDEYPDDLADQGSALEQLAARAMSYGDRAKNYRACTPTVDGDSHIDAGYQDGDRRQYQLKCPHCGAHQALHIERLQPDGIFACVNGCLIEEHHKTTMLVERSACAGCGEVPVRQIHETRPDGTLCYADECACTYLIDPPAPDGAYWNPTHANGNRAHRSYHAWAAYTPEGLGPSWKEIARKRDEAERDPTKRAAFANLICGETYEGERTSHEDTEIMQLAEPGVHAGIVPRGGLLLTAGIDAQHDRFEVQIIAWGRGQRGRVVEYAVIDGDPSNQEGFAKLDAYLQGLWPNTFGKHLHIACIAIDGGNWTESVAQWVRSKVGESNRYRLLQVGDSYRKQYVYLVRGRSDEKGQRAVYRPAKTEVSAQEKTIARSVGMWGVGTGVIKHMLYSWLTAALVAKQDAEKTGEADPIDQRMLRFPGGRGTAYDPINPDTGALPPAYYEGLVSEVFDQNARKWVKRRRGIRNEPLDTAVYAYWAALSPALKIDVMREPQWRELEQYFEPEHDLFSAGHHGGAHAPDVSRETTHDDDAPAAPHPEHTEKRTAEPVHPAARMARRGTRHSGL